ncbi:CPBP family glutamic-type intramembrane protease [soil metagenome]
MSYYAATRHPWACLVFLVPLLAAYEFGVLWLGGPNAIAYRNGADAWLRWGLERYGFGQVFAAPALIVGIFLVRSFLGWKDRPTNLFAVTFGMLVESLVFAILLWMISRNFLLLLDQAGVNLLQLPPAPSAAGPIITYVGAGIYEEVIFRLGLFSIAAFLLQMLLFPKPFAYTLAAVAAALVFAGAHHIGPYGESPIKPEVFLFRVCAGLFFTALYVFRGFGIAVGAHAGYDILVGVVLQPQQV